MNINKETVMFESQDFYVQLYMYVVGISWQLYKACDPSILLKLQNTEEQCKFSSCLQGPSLWPWHYFLFIWLSQIAKKYKVQVR